MISLLHVLYHVRRQAKSVEPVVLGLRQFFTLLVSTTEGEFQGPGMLCGVYQQGLLEDRARLFKQLQGHHCPLCVNVQPHHPSPTKASIYSSAQFSTPIHQQQSDSTCAQSCKRTDSHFKIPLLCSHTCRQPTKFKSTFPQQHKPTIASMPTTKSVALKATHHSSPTMHLHCDPAHHHKCAHLHTSTL